MMYKKNDSGIFIVLTDAEIERMKNKKMVILDCSDTNGDLTKDLIFLNANTNEEAKAIVNRDTKIDSMEDAIRQCMEIIIEEGANMAGVVLRIEKVGSDEHGDILSLELEKVVDNSDDGSEKVH